WASADHYRRGDGIDVRFHLPQCAPRFGADEHADHEYNHYRRRSLDQRKLTYPCSPHRLSLMHLQSKSNFSLSTRCWPTGCASTSATIAASALTSWPATLSRRHCFLTSRRTARC